MICTTHSANRRGYSSRQFIVLAGDDETRRNAGTAKPCLIFSQLNLAHPAFFIPPVTTPSQCPSQQFSHNVRDLSTLVAGESSRRYKPHNSLAQHKPGISASLLVTTAALRFVLMPPPYVEVRFAVHDHSQHGGLSIGFAWFVLLRE